MELAGYIIRDFITLLSLLAKCKSIILTVIDTKNSMTPIFYFFKRSTLCLKCIAFFPRSILAGLVIDTTRITFLNISLELRINRAIP